MSLYLFFGLVFAGLVALSTSASRKRRSDWMAGPDAARRARGIRPSSDDFGGQSGL